MRETLIYLTHLDPEDTQAIMLEKLQNQVNDREWSWANLNTLCWAIGSISGAMNEEDEKKFLVTVIKDLLGLCEQKRGKDNKAVVASDIMYIVGQYPRFLRAHWRFLKTVVNKLFEFMHELHPGVQDMACDTFLKIAQKCRRKFVVTQVSEQVPFIEEILMNLQVTIHDLTPQQIHTFYEATGYMIASNPDPIQREALIMKLMYLPNVTWAEIIQNAGVSLEYLNHPDISKSLTNILKTNTRAATSLGHCYIVQLQRIFGDLMNFYKVYSQLIVRAISAGGVQAHASTAVRYMRGVKREVLRLLEAFIARAEDPTLIYQSFVPPLLDSILGDYKAVPPELRDAEVLQLLSTLVDKLGQPLTPNVPAILDHVFDSTLSMITANFESYPETRVHFFQMLRMVNQHCFGAFLMVPPAHFKVIIDSIVWGFKHPTTNIAECSMYILLELWKNITSTQETAQAFAQGFLLSLLQELFVVLTDTFHKAAFKLHATMLMSMIDAVESGQVSSPLWNPATHPNINSNQAFLREHLFQMLARSFSNLNQQQITMFVQGMFAHCKDLPSFKAHLRDFLVQLKEFAGADNSDLFLDEREQQLLAQKEQEKKKLAVPGMVAPQNQANWNPDLLPDDMS
jgi:exportin-1